HGRVRERPSSLILAQPSRRSSGALLHLEFYAAEPLERIEGRAVDFNRIDRGATLLPGAPCLRVRDAPVSLGGRLGHVALPGPEPGRLLVWAFRMSNLGPWASAPWRSGLVRSPSHMES